ncbi:zinc finger, C2H2 type [Ostertagia ostertagi]
MVKQNTIPPVDISHIEGAKGYPCNFCEFKGRTVNDIRRHTSSAHSEFFPSLGTKLVSPCHHCNQVLDSRGKLLKHIGDCHEDIPLAFKCAYCPKTFATSRGVREHERRSHESRLFLDAEHLVCPHCEQEFQNKRNRDEHVKRHNNPNSVIGRGF